MKIEHVHRNDADLSIVLRLHDELAVLGEEDFADEVGIDVRNRRDRHVVKCHRGNSFFERNVRLNVADAEACVLLLRFLFLCVLLDDVMQDACLGQLECHLVAFSKLLLDFGRELDALVRICRIVEAENHRGNLAARHDRFFLAFRNAFVDGIIKAMMMVAMATVLVKLMLHFIAAFFELLALLLELLAEIFAANLLRHRNESVRKCHHEVSQVHRHLFVSLLIQNKFPLGFADFFVCIHNIPYFRERYEKAANLFYDGFF